MLKDINNDVALFSFFVVVVAVGPQNQTAILI